jgi:uncharacterized protein
MSDSNSPVNRANLISRRRFLVRASSMILGLGVPVIGGSTYAVHIEPAAVETTHISIPIRNLPAQFDGVTIVQISDWHMGDWMTKAQMMSIVQQVNELNADIVVATGDFISRKTDYVFDDVTDIIRQLSAREALFGVLGNHDRWTMPVLTQEAIERAGNLQLLVNRNVAIRRNDQVIYVAGVGDIWQKEDDLPAALDGIPTDAPTILLAHEPDYADKVSLTKRVSLQLSGHSHGGQVALPFIGPLILPSFGQIYHTGLYNVNGMMQYTNRGLGMIRPYVRFNCRPEITHITLRPA